MPDPADIERVRREAMDTLERLSDFGPRRDSRLEDPLERRSRPAEPAPAKRELETPPAAVAEPDWSGWERWADAKIAAALERERAFMLQVVGEALGSAIDDLADDHKRDLSGKVAELKLELAKLTTVVAEFRIGSAEGGRAVLDLPPLPTRPRNVN
jgi:hypothetical protein